MDPRESKKTFFRSHATAKVPAKNDVNSRDCVCESNLKSHLDSSAKDSFEQKQQSFPFDFMLQWKAQKPTSTMILFCRCWWRWWSESYLHNQMHLLRNFSFRDLQREQKKGKRKDVKGSSIVQTKGKNTNRWNRFLREKFFLPRIRFCIFRFEFAGWWFA